MEIYEQAQLAAKTSIEPIKRYPQFADRSGDPEAAAQAWTDAGFHDQMTARWLEARCFDAPGGARTGRARRDAGAGRCAHA